MTRDEWTQIERALQKPEVRLVMAGRCEEQGHQWVGGCTFGPPHMVNIYEVCKWCEEFRASIQNT